jgi:hypothetical protein
MAFLLPLRPWDYGRCPWQLMPNATSSDGSCERAQSVNALPATIRFLPMHTVPIRFTDPEPPLHWITSSAVANSVSGIGYSEPGLWLVHCRDPRSSPG